MKRFVSVVLALVLFSSMGMQSKAVATQEVVAQVDLTHSHVGSSSASGGCYTTPENYSWSQQCTGYSGGAWQYNGGWYVTCTTCNNYWAVPGDCSFQKCTKTITHTGTRYLLSCGADADAVIGTFKITKIRDTEYILSPSVTASSSLCVPVSYTWDTGNEGDLTVTANGTYTCTLSWKDNGAVKTATLQYVVTDYDTEPPVVSDVVRNMSRVQDCVVAEVTATDNFGVTEYKLEQSE